MAGIGAQAVRAGRAAVELVSKNDQLYKGLDAAKKKLADWGKSVMRKGGVLGGVGAAVGAPLFELFKQAADRGSDVQKLAERFGTTTTAVQELAYAFERGGMDVEQFGGFLDGLAGSITAAADANAELIPGLRGLNGRVLINKSVPEQIDAIADGLAAIVNEQDRVSRAKALGLDGMLPYLKDGAAGLKRLKEEAEGAGAVFSAEEAKEGRETMLAWNRVLTDVKYTLLAVGRALLPGAGSVRDLADSVGRYLKQAREWVANNRGLIVTVAIAAAGVVAAGAAVTALGAAAYVASGALGLLGTVLGALTSPLGLTALAVGGLTYLFVTQTEEGARWASSVGSYFEEVKRNAVSSFSAIGDALAGGDLTGAWQIFTAFLQVEWERAWGGAKKVLIDTWDFFADGWDSAVYLLRNLWNDFSTWMGKTILDVMDGVWGRVGEGATRMFGGLADALEKAGFKRQAAEVRGLLDTLNTPHIFQAAKGALDKEHDAEAKRASDELDRLKAFRAFAVGAARAEIDGTIAAAQARLDALLESRKGLGLGHGGVMGDWGDSPPGSILPALQKGIFSGPAQQQLGYADQVGQRQLDKLTEVAGNTKQIADNMGRVNQIVAK